mmetsp:Transcript_51769/g.130905  ORF Transcript_51769/g.130905 Transcript_51769/m.130905 type:complete len:305 (+) Transcript_51769:1537-2451(+)
MSRCLGTRILGARPCSSATFGAASLAAGCAAPSSPSSSPSFCAARFALASARICLSSEGVTPSPFKAAWLGLWPFAPLSFKRSALTDMGIGKPPLHLSFSMTLKSFFTSSWPLRKVCAMPSAAMSTTIFNMFGYCIAWKNVLLLTAQSAVMQYWSFRSRSGLGGLKLYGRWTCLPPPCSGDSIVRSCRRSLWTMFRKSFWVCPFLKRICVLTQHPGSVRSSCCPCGISPLASNCSRYWMYSLRLAGSETSLQYSSMWSRNCPSFIALVSFETSSCVTPFMSPCMKPAMAVTQGQARRLAACVLP